MGWTVRVGHVALVAACVGIAASRAIAQANQPPQPRVAELTDEVVVDGSLGDRAWSGRR